MMHRVESRISHVIWVGWTLSYDWIGMLTEANIQVVNSIFAHVTSM